MFIPIFTFIVSSCVIPEKYKKEIESKCFKFIWNGKPDKVKRNALIGDFEKDGLKMINIESYFISISTLPNIERFRFDHDKNKLFIFSNFFSQLSFSHSM
jgi:nucleoside diphosphate kinase